jgi:hypothetical protein
VPLSARRLLTAPLALLATVGLAAALPACSSSSSGPGAPATTSPEDRVATDAEVAQGLAEVQALADRAVEQLATDKAAATATVEQLYDTWYAVEGTIKRNDVSTYLDLEDGLGAVKRGVDQGDQAKASGGAAAFATSAASYLSRFPAPGAGTATTATPGATP